MSYKWVVRLHDGNELYAGFQIRRSPLLDLQRVALKVPTSRGASIDTTVPTGEVVFGVFEALAEFERDLISERTRTVLTLGRARGRKGGAPFKMTPARLRLLMTSMGTPGAVVGQLCRDLGVTRQR